MATSTRVAGQLGAAREPHDALRPARLEARAPPARPAARRRSAAPGRARGARGRRPRGRWGSRGSSRSASSGRPGRRAPRARPARSAGPPTRRRRPRRARPARRRRSPGRRSRSSACGREAEPLGELERRRAPPARCRRGGTRRAAGRSEMPARSSSRRASASRSRSSHAYGTRLRASRSRAVVRLGREAVPDDARLRVGQHRVGLPVAEQVVERRVEPLLRRVPGLLQVVVDLRAVDRARSPPRCRRRRSAARAWRRVRAPRAASSSSTPVIAGHALVGEHERDGLAAPAQLAQQLVRLGAGAGAQHAVVLAEAARAGRAGRRAGQAARRRPPAARGAGSWPRGSSPSGR